MYLHRCSTISMDECQMAASMFTGLSLAANGEALVVRVKLYGKLTE